MKFITIRTFAALLLVATFFNLSMAKASPIAIAVVDLESVFKNSDAMKDAQSKIDKKQAIFQKEIDKKQEALEKESKQIIAKKSVLSEDAFAKEQEKFTKKANALREFAESKKKILEEVILAANSKIKTKVTESVEEVRTEKNLDVILSSSSTIFYKDELDISSDVTAKLNKKISKIEIK